MAFIKGLFSFLPPAVRSVHTNITLPVSQALYFYFHSMNGDSRNWELFLQNWKINPDRSHNIFLDVMENQSTKKQYFLHMRLNAGWHDSFEKYEGSTAFQLESRQTQEEKNRANINPTIRVSTVGSTHLNRLL